MEMPEKKPSNGKLKEEEKEGKDTPDIINSKNKADTNKFNDELYNRREKYRHKAFTLMLELAFIIGIPAFLALWGGKKLDIRNESGLLYTSIFLGIAFILSWTAIIFKYIKFSKEIKKTDQEIRKAKNKI